MDDRQQSAPHPRTHGGTTARPTSSRRRRSRSLAAENSTQNYPTSTDLPSLVLYQLMHRDRTPWLRTEISSAFPRPYLEGKLAGTHALRSDGFASAALSDSGLRSRSSPRRTCAANRSPRRGQRARTTNACRRSLMNPLCVSGNMFLLSLLQLTSATY